MGWVPASDENAIHDNVAGEIAALTEKTTPVDADLLIIEDSEDTNAKKKVQLSNLGGGADELNDLSDVDLSTPPTDGQVLKYDNSSSSWLAADDDTGSGSLPTPSAKGDLAVYDGDSWEILTVGTNNHVLTAASGEALGVKWAAASGGGGGAATFLESTKSSSDDPPDDEFDDSSGMSGATNGLDDKWTAVSGTEAAVALIETGDVARYDLDTVPGKLLLQVGNATANEVELRQDYTLPDGDSIILAVSPGLAADNGNNDIWLGLGLNSTDTGYDDGASTQRINFHVENNGEPSILLYDGTTIIFDQSFVSVETVFLRIVRSNLTYYAFYSHDGESWQPAGSKTVSAALSNIWIYMDCLSEFNQLPPIASVHWIRKGSDDFDPWDWRS